MLADPVARFRRFARAVTTELGALDDSFLGRGRPLGSARMLNAIGSGRSDVADLRTYLGLDSGLVSRLLRGLEEQGLVTTTIDRADARRRIATLTAAGQREFEAYEQISDQRARAVLARSGRADDLLRAMDEIASALSAASVVIEELDPSCDAARYCLGEYYGELERRFAGGFQVERSRDPDVGDLVRPRGAFLVAVSDGMPIGCVALKGNGGAVAEIKRLWIDPAARCLGIGRRLMMAAETMARDLGITTLRLDTNEALPEAVEMYRRADWTEIERFNDDPYAHYFFEKHL